MSIQELPFSSPSSSTPKLVQRVPKSTSDKLLLKFFDATHHPQFGFDYETSGLWSPPLQRTVYLSSSGQVLNQTDLQTKLHNLFNSPPPPTKRTTCFKFKVFWCWVRQI